MITDKNVASEKFHISDKWPCCIVTGREVSDSQAMEMIWRLDNSMNSSYMEYMGNDTDFRNWFKKIMNAPTDKVDYGNTQGEDLRNAINTHYENCRKMNQILGLIETNYFNTSWICSSYIYGPHGWIHPNGYIGFSDNIGKWPTVEEVWDDWEIIAKAFPFLNVDVTIMDGEDGYYHNSVFSLHIEQGKISAYDKPIPVEDLKLHAGDNPYTRRKAKNENHLTNILISCRGERFFNESEIVSWKIPTYDENGNKIPDKYWPMDHQDFWDKEN